MQLLVVAGNHSIDGLWIAGELAHRALGPGPWPRALGPFFSLPPACLEFVLWFDVSLATGCLSCSRTVRGVNVFVSTELEKTKVA